MQSTPVSAVTVESASQAGAGGLLVAVGIVELGLRIADGGWWHRGGAALVVALGMLTLVWAIVSMTRSSSARRPTFDRSIVRAADDRRAAVQVDFESDGRHLDNLRVPLRGGVADAPPRAVRVALAREPQPLS